MVRNSYPPYLSMSWPTIPWPTFQNRSTPSDASDKPSRNPYTPGQSAYSATRDQSAYTQRQSQNAHEQRQSPNSYPPSDRSSYKPNNNNNGSTFAASSSRNRDRIFENQVLDDQIAPSATSHSIEALQRFANATSYIPTCPPRSNEVRIVERIEKRYGAGREGGGPKYEGGFEERENKERKRGRELVEAEREEGERKGKVKKRRIGGEEEVIDLTKEEGEEEYDYAESSEGCWPGDDH